MTTILSGVEGIRAHIGQPLGVSDDLVVTQERIDDFARATGDKQWIHVDPVRAAAGPYGRTIAHGLLTLSIIGALSPQVFRFDGFRMALNYGYEKIRFPTPVPVDSVIRLRAKVLGAEDVAGGIQTLMELLVEVEGQPKPACIAQMLFRHLLHN